MDPLSGYASQELKVLADKYDARSGRFGGKQSGQSYEADPNPFIKRDYDNCISCYRCVRVCAEQEGDYAITVMNRGFSTKISTEFEGLLNDSACTFCGQCVQTCPTGALADLKALANKEVPGETKKTRTVCTYCGVGCSIDVLSREDKVIGVLPAMDGPANNGALCVKAALHREDALDHAAKGLSDVVEEHGRHSLYAIASGRAPNEVAYVMQKFVRAGLGTNYIDNCSRA